MLKRKNHNLMFFVFLEYVEAWSYLLEYVLRIYGNDPADIDIRNDSKANRVDKLNADCATLKTEIGKLIIMDALECTDIITQSYMHDTEIDYSLNKKFIKFLLNCYGTGFENIVRQKINTNTIRHMLDVYRMKSYKSYEIRALLLGAYNGSIDDIFLELIELDRLGIINMKELDTRHSYKIIKKIENIIVT